MALKIQISVHENEILGVDQSYDDGVGDLINVTDGNGWETDHGIREIRRLHLSLKKQKNKKKIPKEKSIG